MTTRRVEIGDAEAVLLVTRQKSLFEVTNQEHQDVIDLVELRQAEAVLVVNGRRELVPFFRKGETIEFLLRGEVYRAEVSDRARPKRHADLHARAPMPGIILKIFVKPGDVVIRGAPLIVLEAMKMEHQISAPFEGVVGSIHCREGELVQPGFDLISLDSKEGG